jgi:DNA repair exonuclease SbcCD nuclease subunit
MKVLFTADLHIKLGQKNVPVEWAKNRYKELFAEISIQSTQVDLTVLGGDIFDKLPNMEELELYFDLINSIHSMCLVYSGNHEALKRNTTFLTSLKSVTNKINPKVKVIDDFYSYKGIDFIPYNKLKDWEKDPDNTFVRLGRVLCTHVRGEIPPHVKPEIPLELFNRWNLVLAGDLHSYENSQKNILYPGSPITTSFHRNRVDTGIIILDTDTLGHRWIKLDLPQLIRKTIKAGEPMPPGERDHIIYEVEGDMAQLAAVAGHDLIDKKVVKRDSDSALILDASMTIAEEVAEYLRYVLNLNEDSVQSVLKELQEYV